MKKLFLFFLLAVLLCSCNGIKYRELYGITDEYVEKLRTTYDSYGLFDIKYNSKSTADKEYSVTPIGRLIIVKIEREADDQEYENLREALESHYSGDNSVNKVYRNQGGTIAIDCRN
ncbi:MAG: ABC transporter [Prevotella sp.]|nr:ABC transporter [Prevotella sp.]